MNAQIEPVETAAPRRRPWAYGLILPGIAFLLGLIAMGLLMTRWDAAAQFLGLRPAMPEAAAPLEPVIPPQQPAAATSETSAGTERIVIDPEITRRVALLEQRIGNMQQATREAVGNADRAEGLLVAFAARRALDRGVALGYIEALLRQRFGQTQPQAVGMVITAARNPVTLQELQDGLQELAPALAGPPPDQSWWDSIRQELGSLVTVRREGTPSTEPVERLRRAMRRLEAGQVDVALAEVMRLPGREHARAWIEDARRYVAARRALDTIETAALLEPRRAQPAQPQPAPAEPPADEAPPATE